MENPKFTKKKDSSNGYVFNLKAGNGEIVLKSESYKSSQGCDNGIESIRKNSALKSNYEVKDSSNGQKYFVLKSPNGEIIGMSETYKSTSGLENGISAVREIGAVAPVEDLA